MSKYTPGPWTHIGFGKDRRVESLDGEILIARITQQSGMDQFKHAANGCLVAASPLMLDALKCAKANMIEQYNKSGYNGDLEIAIDLVEYAIAKAEGRSNE